MLSPREILGAAIVRAIDEKAGVAPYFAAVLRGLVRRETDETPMLAVSKHGVLYWNPAWVGQQSVPVLALGLLHEVMHVVLKHHERAEAFLGVSVEPGQPVDPELARKFQLANLAEDACINEQLRKIPLPAGIQIPAEWIYPETLQQPEGLVFEDRLRRLLDQKPPQRQQGQGKQGQGGGQGQQPQQGQGGGQGQGQQPGQQPGQGQGKGQGKGQGREQSGVGRGACGSCAGNPSPGEAPSQQQQQQGGDGRSEAEMDRIRRQVAEAVREHAASSKGRGTVPDGLVRWADDVLAPPKVDWRTKLAQIVRGAVAYRAGAADHSYVRPSRRQAGLGWGAGVPVLPAFRSPVPSVGVIFDTSGSMGADDLALGASEVKGVLDAVGASVSLAVVDAKLHGLAEVRTVEDAVKMLKGGGGTDMRPGFRALEQQRTRPDVVIVLTDGLLGDGLPSREPHWAKVIWVLLGQHRHRPCDWGDVVEIDEDGAREAA